MANIVQKRFPLDISQRTGIGFNFPIDGPAVFNQTFETREQIKANLLNYLLTNQGERVFNPNFGADLRLLLFDFQSSASEDLQEILQDKVKELFPTVNIEQFELNRLEDQHTIQLSIVYSIQSFGISDSISINLS
jgi:phage baseplate assembly protein W|tara:strand:+ start:3687 stop:4091 length:405 start_codon:yes stop_codon:yes gene_type:complete